MEQRLKIFWPNIIERAEKTLVHIGQAADP
jgi:hypothetical protein